MRTDEFFWTPTKTSLDNINKSGTTAKTAQQQGVEGEKYSQPPAGSGAGNVTVRPYAPELAAILAGEL